MTDFRDLAVPGVQQLQPYIPGKPVETLERELGISDSIKLASNENPLGPSPLGVKAARSVLEEMNLYPDGGAYKLTDALARKHGVDASWITIGNGSNDILELIGRAFLSPHNAALYSEYSFAIYPIVTQAVGAQHRVAKAIAADDTQMPYGHDLDAFRQQLDEQVRVVFIANPNNPTGTWLEVNTLEQFISEVGENTLVVLDEAYYEYMPDELKPDTDRWLKQFANLVVTRTFSKIYGLAGLRIGYAVSHPDVADVLNRVRQPFNSNLAAQAAALAALQDTQHLQTSIEVNREGMQQLLQGFEKLNFTALPSIANFLAVNFNTDAQPIYEKLLREGVIVRPMGNYNMGQFLRITIGDQQQNSRVLTALEKVLA